MTTLDVNAILQALDGLSAEDLQQVEQRVSELKTRNERKTQIQHLHELVEEIKEAMTEEDWAILDESIKPHLTKLVKPAKRLATSEK